MINSDMQRPLPQGTFLEEYCIESELGSGGFGITYLARDTKLNYYVAIKEYFPQAAWRDSRTKEVTTHPGNMRDAFESGLARFRKEGEILARFRHQNIVRVLRILEANETAYLVMDYEEGETLEQHLQHNRGALSYDHVHTIFMPILDGLREVHNKGLLHLDIKPENIFLRAEGTPFLIDFGGARHHVGKASQSVSFLVASDGYAPPEQYSSKGLGEAADIYAIAATIFRCITGFVPVDAQLRSNAMIDEEPDPLKLKQRLKLLAPRYPEHFLSAVERALQLASAKRQATALKLQSELFAKRSNKIGKRTKPLKRGGDSEVSLVERVLLVLSAHQKALMFGGLGLLVLGISLLIWLSKPYPDIVDPEPVVIPVGPEPIPDSIVVEPEPERIVTEEGLNLNDLVSEDELRAIGMRIWINEAGKNERERYDNVVVWNKTEKFASMGIGHFIWKPETGGEDSFPKLLAYLDRMGVILPDWLADYPPCPWSNRSEFIAERDVNSPRIAELRELMLQTIPQQAAFLFKRLENTLPDILNATDNDTQRLQIKEQFYRVAHAQGGVYALWDYTHFKGKGINPDSYSRYREGWGLLQVLEEMEDKQRNPDALSAFVKAGIFVLERRVRNAPADIDDGRWINGWRNRLNTYLEYARR